MPLKKFMLKFLIALLLPFSCYGQSANSGRLKLLFIGDIMGHKDLGGNTILYLVDGLWGSVNWGHPCVKFAMPPFNNDWPSSLFTSFDPVAI